MEAVTAENTELITVEELIDCIAQYMQEEYNCLLQVGKKQDICTGDIWARGLQKKWLEPQDVSGKNALIERRQAARILHEFLKRERQEPDLADWDPAKCLLDLYDCRICVNHVAQVYCKGIMEGITEHIFGMKEGILREELTPIVGRVFDPAMRIKRFDFA